MMSLAGLSFLGPPVIGVALYQLAMPAPFLANAVLLAIAFLVCFTSPQLRRLTLAATPAADGPSSVTPPASQPGPEGNR